MRGTITINCLRGHGLKSHLVRICRDQLAFGRATALFASLVCQLFQAGPAYADVVFTQPVASNPAGLVSDVVRERQGFDSFVLIEDSSVANVQWYGQGSTCVTRTFAISLWANDPTGSFDTPGSEIFETTATKNGTPVEGSTSCLYRHDLSAAVPLSGGTIYWLSVQATDDTWAWAVSSESGLVLSLNTSTGEFILNGSNVAFLLSTASVDDQSVLVDDGITTYDPIARQEWLDLTRTVGRSFNDVFAETVDGEFRGFRVPTQHQVSEFIAHAGIAFQDNTDHIEDGPAVGTLIDLLGETATNSFFKNSLGFFDLDTRDPDTAGCLILQVRLSTGAGRTGFNNCGALADKNRPDPNYGVFLYRPPSDVDGDGIRDLDDPCPADHLNECNLDGSSADQVTSQDGGSVVTPDGSLELDIDSGDLSSDTTISITQTVFNDPEVDLTVGATPGVGQAVAFYDLEPDGLEFNSPATLTVTADVSGLSEAKRMNLDVYRLEDTNGDGIEDALVAMMAVCNVDEGPVDVFTATCTVEVDHFTSFALIAPADRDGDGVFDSFKGEVDACADEDATGFDVDENGCIDTFGGLEDLVGTLVAEDVISSTLENSLLSKLENAEESADRENICTAVNELAALDNQIKAQTGKKISTEAGQLVRDFSASVAAFLQSGDISCN